MKCCSDSRSVLLLVLALLLSLIGAPGAEAGVPLDLYRSFAGQVNFTGTGGSLRTAANAVDACAVGSSSSGDLTGLPSGAMIDVAYLYWAGSWSTAGGSTSTSPDWDVVLDGQAITADRTFLETFTLGTDYDFFSGFADITTQVAAKGNGTYTFAGLDVNTGSPHCGVQAVLAGWSMVVVYRHPLESNRVVNVYDGFQYYRGGEIVVVADNFRIAATGIDGKACHITWEGDETNSQSLGGYQESLRFNGSDLTDLLNPVANQFNSTINVLGRNDTWGVDFDIYDVTPWLSPGDAMATSRYASGQDLVLLSAEVISVTNEPTADLTVTMTHPADLPMYQDSDLIVTVTNLGPADENNLVTTTITLPVGLDYVAAAGSGWTVDASGLPVISASTNASLSAGQSLPSLVVTLRPDGGVTGGVALSTTVDSPTFDHQPGNNIAASVANIVEPAAALGAVKNRTTVEDPLNGTTNPKAIPGAFVEYDVEISNRHGYRIDRNTVYFVDAVPAGTALFVADLPTNNGPVRFTEGPVRSGLRFRFRGLADNTDDVWFSADGGASWTYAPTPDLTGCDPTVTHVRVRPRGRMRQRTAAGPSSFSLAFRIRVD